VDEQELARSITIESRPQGYGIGIAEGVDYRLDVLQVLVRTRELEFDALQEV
jgi:hypothetical protein